MSWNFKLDNVETYAYQNNVFTEAECKEIIKLSNCTDKSNPITFDGKNEEYRPATNLYWVKPSEKTNWIFERLTDAVLQLNSKFFKFNLFGFNDSLQLTHYHSKGARYKKHIDRGFNYCVRKLSVSVQLSEPTSYEGSDLLLHISEEPIYTNKKIGCLTVFPSWVLHEVTPLQSGERYSLVCWATGEQFV